MNQPLFSENFDKVMVTSYRSRVCLQNALDQVERRRPARPFLLVRIPGPSILAHPWETGNSEAHRAGGIS